MGFITLCSSACSVGAPIVYGEPCGLPLIPIVSATPRTPVPCPCEWSQRGLLEIRSIVDFQDVYTPGDQRRFKQALIFRGFFGCDKGSIERPDLWVEAYEIALSSAGQNFQSIYSDLLKEATIGIS